MDLRTQKTYDALAQAFIELLAGQSFEDITVNGLCERARVRRATFYNHFADKYAFLEFMVRRIRREGIGLIQHNASLGAPALFFTALVRESLAFIEAYRLPLGNLQVASTAAFLVGTDAGELSQQVRERLEAYADLGYPLAGDPEVLAEFVLGAIGQVGRWWFEQDGSVSAEEVIVRLAPIFESIFPDRQEPGGPSSG